MKRIIAVRYVILLVTALLSAAVVLSLCFGVRRINDAPVTRISNQNGTFAANSISDLAALNIVTAVNYTPDEFLLPKGGVPGQIFDLSEDGASSRGTYEFVIAHLDPFSDEFEEQSEALSPYLKGDGNWHFTLYIPAVWSACAVYVNYTLTEMCGEIKDYDFINYSEYSHRSERHDNATEPLFLDLKFYPRQAAISPAAYDAATVVTIHYEAEKGRAAGILGKPLIGDDAAVRNIVSRDNRFYTVQYSLAALIIAIFIFLCFLKRTRFFLPHVMIMIGVFGILVSAFSLAGATGIPYMWKAVESCSYAFAIFSALLTLKVRTGKFPLWGVTLALAGAYCAAAFVLPLVSLGQFDLELFRAVCNAVFFAVICAFALLLAKNKRTDVSLLLVPLLTGFLGLAFYVPNASPFGFVNPVFWLCALILLINASVSCRVFLRLEKRNRYLTENLQSEVAIQTRELKAVIEERDDLLRYVSHDMKKPAVSIGRYIAVLQEREKDEELKKAVKIMRQKADELIKNLDDLSMYAKSNYVAESSACFNADDVLSQSCAALGPDCEANGITLEYRAAELQVYGKKNGLLSVVNNLIINAVEHAQCTSITISAYRRRNTGVIAVTDDGKGLGGQDVFRPYYSENPSDKNLGLGLYLCKNAMQSMNGDLTYEQQNGKLTFFITLPLA